MLRRQEVEHWLRRYERAWRSPGTAALRDVFTAEADYRQSPYHEPAVGLAAIGALWEREREGPDEEFTMESEIVAVEGDTAVVRVEVRYGEPPAREYRDLWVVRFAEGLCSDFEEWPFWPDRPYAAPRDE